MDLHTFDILSVCSGVGGLELGFKLAVPNSRVVCYVESEAYAAAVLAERIRENVLDKAPIWSDLRTFDGRPWRGKVDCLVGGYPCQPFSAAGKKLADKDPRHLWPFVASLIRDVRPPVCFFENVRGHLSLGFEEVARELSGMGYAVKAGLFSAAEVGATHNRERLFILAYRDDDGRGGGGNDNGQRPICPLDERKPSPLDEDGLEPKPRACENVAAMADDTDLGEQRGVFDGSRGRKREEAPYERNSALGAFPPNPNDTERWSGVPDYLKPSILRVADGSSDRVDRIRACGNGVVPLVAAYAWRTLTADLELKWKE